MATADLNQVMQVPGRLCIGPTDLTTAFPHGGTALGEVYQAVATQTSSWFDVRAEEFGGIPVDAVFSGESWVFGAVLRQFDETAIGTVFPNTVTGTTTKRVGIKSWLDAASPVRPGALASSRSVKLLFSPLDPIRNRAVIFYRAMPRVTETLNLALAFNKRVEVPVLFVAMPDATSRLVRVDFLKELAV